MVRLSNLLQGISPVTGLTTAAMLPFPTPTAGLGLFQPITTGWLATVLAILGHLIPQGLDLSGLLSYGLL